MTFDCSAVRSIDATGVETVLSLMGSVRPYGGNCDEVLPPVVRAGVSGEQASTLGWDRCIGDGAAAIGTSSALIKFGFTSDRVPEVARERVAAARRRNRGRNRA